MDKIFIEDLRLFGKIGVFEFEKENGQEFVLSIKLSTDLRPAGASDMLEDTVSYADVCSLASQFMESSSDDLLESFAHRLALKILNDYSSVVEVWLRISKPNAPIDADFGTVGVEITRHRDG